MIARIATDTSVCGDLASMDAGFVMIWCRSVAMDALCVVWVILVPAAMARSCGLAASGCVVVASKDAVDASSAWGVCSLRFFRSLAPRLAVGGSLGVVSVLCLSLWRRGSLASDLLGELIMLSRGGCEISVLGSFEDALLVVEIWREVARLGSMPVSEPFVDDSTLDSTATWCPDVVVTAAEEGVPTWWTASTFFDAYEGFAFPAGHFGCFWV